MRFWIDYVSPRRGKTTPFRDMWAQRHAAYLALSREKATMDCLEAPARRFVLKQAARAQQDQEKMATSPLPGNSLPTSSSTSRKRSTKKKLSESPSLTEQALIESLEEASGQYAPIMAPATKADVKHRIKSLVQELYFLDDIIQQEKQRVFHAPDDPDDPIVSVRVYSALYRHLYKQKSDLDWEMLHSAKDESLEDPDDFSMVEKKGTIWPSMTLELLEQWKSGIMQKTEDKAGTKEDTRGLLSQRIALFQVKSDLAVRLYKASRKQGPN